MARPFEDTYLAKNMYNNISEEIFITYIYDKDPEQRKFEGCEDLIKVLNEKTSSNDTAIHATCFCRGFKQLGSTTEKVLDNFNRHLQLFLEKKTTKAYKVFSIPLDSHSEKEILGVNSPISKMHVTIRQSSSEIIG